MEGNINKCIIIYKSMYEEFYGNMFSVVVIFLIIKSFLNNIMNKKINVVL